MMIFDRRDFVKGAAVAGAAVALAGVAGCAPASLGSPQGAAGKSSGSASLVPSASAPSDASDAATASRVITANSTPGGSPVYYTDDISAAGLLAVYRALGFSPSGKVAVKLHMGEEGNANYLDPKLLRPLVEEIGGTFVDTTVLYGKRSTVAGYYEVAADHGFTYAPEDILDETGGITLHVTTRCALPTRPRLSRATGGTRRS